MKVTRVTVKRVCLCVCVSAGEREKKVVWQDGEEGVSLGDTVPPRPNLFTSGRARGSQRMGEEGGNNKITIKTTKCSEKK